MLPRALLALALLAACADRGRPAADGGQPPDGGCRPDGGRLEAAAGATATPGPRRHRAEDDAPRRPRSILLAEAREEIGWKVADGFLSREEIIDFVTDVVADRPSLRREIEAITDETLEDHRRREATWQYATDPDRLERAFSALEKEGVLARLRLSDCPECGVAEMRGLREQEVARGRAPVGFVFSTERDTDGVSAGRALLLHFGSFDGPAAPVGQRVVAALTRAGLRPELRDGEDELTLPGLEWRKRRFTRPR